jgi:hypothetical protein
MTVQSSVLQKSAELTALVGRIGRELQTNRRAAVGLLVLGCLAAGYGLLSLDDAIGSMATSYAEATHRLERVLSSGQEKDWPARAAASAEIRKSLEARLWKVESEGMARADLQDWVTNHARDAGLEKAQVRIELTKPTGMPADFRQLTATITATDTEASLFAFLDQIKREPRLLVVDHLLVRQRPVSSLEMKLVAYASLPGNGSAKK